MADAAISVLFADDQPIVCQGLNSLAASANGLCVVGAAATAQEAWRLTVLHKPDVLVADIELPGFGPGSIRALSRSTPGTAVLVFTRADDEEVVIDCILAGARGFLPKTGPGEDVIRAIECVGRGGMFLGPAAADRLMSRLADGPEPDPFPELTAREREIFLLIGAGLRNAAIAARLQLAPKTVSNHISAILAKLSVDSRHEAAELARKARPGRGEFAPGARRLELVTQPSAPARVGRASTVVSGTGGDLSSRGANRAGAADRAAATLCS